MRNPSFVTRSATAAALALSLGLAACAGEAPEASDDADSVETIETDMEADAISDEAIEEAVPGIEDADAEGDTPNTADLDDQENLEVNDIGEPTER